MARMGAKGSLLISLLVICATIAPGRAQATADPPRWYSSAYESSVGDYWGFAHRLQHKSVGALGSGAGVELACENPNPGFSEPNFAFHNLWGASNVTVDNETYIEIHPRYHCGPIGGRIRGWSYQFWRDGAQVYAHPVQSFSDTNAEHQYAIVHYHNSSLTCGSLGDDNSWFVTQDGLKVGCAGFHDLQFAPHFITGVSGLELNNGVYGRNKSRDHYYSQIQYFNGSTWPWVDRDAQRIDWQPAGGRGATVVPRNWWRACSGFTQTCL